MKGYLNRKGRQSLILNLDSLDPPFTLMTNTFLTLALLASLSMSAQNNKKDILKSTNIMEIESFLKTAHPDDPRRNILKSKVFKLKNDSWMKPQSTSSATTKIKPTQIPAKNVNSKDFEDAEFQRLLHSESKKEKTVQLLNQLFDNDISNKQAILLVQNNSDCNMILKIDGKEQYDLAIPSRGENSVVLNKGEYSLRGNVCEIPYSSGKSIAKNTMVRLTKN